ncbi:MAG: hypothetical protein NVS2B14_17230 [Chamaesiphon sp.]
MTLGEANTLVDVVWWLMGLTSPALGCVEESGSARPVLTEPKSDRLQAFLSRMNFTVK